MSKAKDEKMAQAFKALGHPVRIQIFNMLHDQGACFAGDLTRHLPVVASTASQHLKIMKDAEVITGTVDGPHRCYCINKKMLLDMKAWARKL
jgi:ArsR family transcriptional regulator